MKKINNFCMLLIFSLACLYALLNPSKMQFSRVLILLSLPFTLLVPRILTKTKILSIENQYEFFYIGYILFAQVFGCLFRFYQIIPYYDKWMHFLSGILSCILALILLKKYKIENKKAFTILFLLFTTLAVASLWEIFEFTSDFILKGDVQNASTTGVGDTMQDIIMAFMGSLLFSLLYWRFRGDENGRRKRN